MTNKLSNIRIVLVNTSHPGNIGSAARAMKTMGLSDLYLVNPKSFPDGKATAMASGAEDILADATVCANLEDALADCILTIGATARMRSIEWPHLNPKQASAKALSHAQQGKMAFIFGRESSGLSNNELDCCQFLLNIDANPEYSSLNLAAAVQIVCYELRMQTYTLDNSSSETMDNEVPASAKEFSGFFNHFQEVLDLVGFLNTEHNESLLRRLRRMFNRIHLSTNEINILRGILRAIQRNRHDKDVN